MGITALLATVIGYGYLYVTTVLFNNDTRY